MARASSSATIYGHGEGEPPDQKTRLNSSSDSHPPAAVPQKRKRNQPGRPNPDAEVIALSPKSLMATNRFICEVCNKGFQRDQNLRLHRRGHNLPWSLRQKGTGEVVKPRVYLCPEPTCVHHDPSRALGDLTGIKKHYFRKHGEKKWKCEKCSKRYAVLSDLKAHSKTCGTREYRCGCGTVFSRRDSFITHRAFCDALAQESAHLTANMNAIKSELYGSNHSVNLGLSQTSSAGDMFRFGGGLGPPDEPSSSSSHFKGFQFPHSILPDKSFPGMLQFQEPQYITATASSSSSSAAASSASSIFNLNFYHSKFQAEHPGSPYKPVPHSDFPLPQISQHGFFHGAAIVNQMESMYPSANAQDAHLRDLMDSLANGNVGVDLAGCSGEPLSFKRVCSRENGGLVREEEHKLQQRLKMEDISGATGFTRDFLGIGSMVRTMISEGDQNGGIDFVPFDSELTSSSCPRPFPGRGWP